jgi:flap endonuclease-1
LLENLGITREQLVEMGILIGTDFFSGIHGIGQHKALDLIKKYKSIKNIVSEKVKVGKKDIQLDLELVEQVKNIFLTPDIRNNYPKIKFSKINYEKIKELLIEIHNFDNQRVENALDRLRKLDSSKTQISLDNFIK